MTFNLIDDPWIPARRRSGGVQLIRPDQILDRGDSGDDPFAMLAAPRPDFNGSLLQFLIALLQTTAAPEDEMAWVEWLEDPPDPSEVRDAFQTVKEHFDLDGGEVRFMQDIDPLKGKHIPISYLLIEAPTANTLKNNADFFVKRTTGEAGLCYSCTAQALFTLQTNAPSGGAGHRTSLRGGGPLTTLVKPSTALSDDQPGLFRDLWANVLVADDFEALNASRKRDLPRFPWSHPTRVSQKKGGVDTNPGDVHPAQVYWATPRRIRLDLQSTSGGTCLVCASESDRLVHRYQQKNYGANYTGNWEHPLSAHRRDKNDRITIKPQPGGISYQNWLGLVAADPDDKKGLIPAANVRNVRDVAVVLGADSPLPGRVDLHAFGYDMDNMKARAWYESTMPIFLEPDEGVRARLDEAARSMVLVADEARSNLVTAVKRALFGTPPKQGGRWRVDANAKAAMFAALSQGFWADTQEQFFVRLGAVHDVLRSGETHDDELEQWLVYLSRETTDMFDDEVPLYAAYGTDPKAATLARRELQIFNSYRAKKLRKLAGLADIKKKQTA